MADILPDKRDPNPIPYFSQQQLSRLFPWLPVLLCALAGALLMPKDDPFPFNYKVGRLWDYPDFYAPFDVTAAPFTNAQSDTIPFLPYYAIDPETGKKQKNALLQLIDEQLRVSGQDAQYEDLIAKPGAYKKYATDLLDYLLKRGIAPSRPEHATEVVIIGSSARRVPVDSLLLLDEAVGIVTDSLPFSPLRQPELLLPILEKVLLPNAFYSDSLTQAGRVALPVPAATSISIKAGERVVKSQQEVTAAIAATLNAISARYDRSSNWINLSGYALYSLMAYFSLLGWVYFFKRKVFFDRNKMLTMLVTILGVQFLVAICYNTGIVVPFLLPLFLLPLLLRPLFGLRTSLVIWSVPVMLSGFALSWGVLWISMQIVGAGTALMLNDEVNSWKSRLTALLVIFLAQTMVWSAFFLAGKLPDALQTTDAIVFLAISVLLSISRSVLVRFFQPLQ